MPGTSPGMTNMTTIPRAYFFGFVKFTSRLKVN